MQHLVEPSAVPLLYLVDNRGIPCYNNAAEKTRIGRKEPDGMNKNECLFLTAENLGADLEGVCRHEGMPVFVPGLLPGETALVRIVKVEKRYAFGRMESAPDPVSPDRRAPDCAAYPRCGGCSGRHMSYAATLAAKRQQAEDCFRRIGGLDVEVLPVLGMKDPAGYRNKTSLPAGGQAGDPVLGFYAPRSHTVIPAASCPNAMPPANSLAAAFLSWMKAFRIEPYREDTRRGLIRHLVIRVNRKGESMVTVVANSGALPHAEELAGALVPLGTVSLWLNENRSATNVILSDRFHIIYGKETLTDTLLGLEFELSPASFFQVNPAQTETLYRTVADLAQLKPSDLLCDVYCGAGTITLTLAGRCREAVGIEIVPAAVENAKRNAVRNGIRNASFRAGKAEELLPRMVADGLRPDVIVVDPPRKGLDPEVIRAIAGAGPDRLVYVSCNPATLARDVGLLKEEGYLVRTVQPVDMFCWTAGVETVCLLSKLHEAKHHVNVKLDMDELDLTSAEAKATYKEIEEWVQEHCGFHVTNLNIAQVKQKHGIIERENYNKPKSENSRQPGCPEEKVKAIEDAMRHFQMI